MSATPPQTPSSPPARAVRDVAAILRALRRAVHTDKLLSREAAYRYLDLQGIPRNALDEPAP